MKHIWATDVPSKIQIFGWRLIQKCIGTRDNLISHGIIDHERNNWCLLCIEGEEPVSHLFFQCRVVVSVWKKVSIWLGVPESIITEPLDHFLEHKKLSSRSKKEEKKSNTLNG